MASVTKSEATKHAHNADSNDADLIISSTASRSRVSTEQCVGLTMKKYDRWYHSNHADRSCTSSTAVAVKTESGSYVNETAESGGLFKQQTNDRSKVSVGRQFAPGFTVLCGYVQQDLSSD